MQIKLFGKNLFEFHTKGGEMYAVPAMEQVQKLKHLPDFKTIGNGDAWGSPVQGWAIQNVLTNTDSTIIQSSAQSAAKVAKTPLTPKKVYELKMLHDKAFKINMDPKYVEEQIAAFKEKLALIKNPSYDHRGFDEIGSILIRMENRKKYADVRATFEQFPYTTNKRIESVLKKHDYLQLGEVMQFVADMPKEATDAMKAYNAATKKLCDKEAVFYVVADKKDFQKTSSRRDPILLAQSPFGHFWQILGAWDKEMLFLEEL